MRTVLLDEFRRFQFELEIHFAGADVEGAFCQIGNFVGNDDRHLCLGTDGRHSVVFESCQCTGGIFRGQSKIEVLSRNRPFVETVHKRTHLLPVNAIFFVLHTSSDSATSSSAKGDMGVALPEE